MKTKRAPVAWLTDREEMYFDKEDAYRASDGFIQPLYTYPIRREFVGLDLPEIEEIVEGNLTITSPHLRDAVYGVVLDTVTTLMEKNT